MNTFPGPTTTWLFETGAEVSVMAQKEFRKIPIGKRPVRKPVKIRISSASKDTLKATGMYEMPITMMGKTVNHDVIVVQNINSHAIMGADLIEHLGLVFSKRRILHL